MQRTGRFSTAATALLLAVAALAPASAATASTLAVKVTRDPGLAGNHRCSLREAIAAVNAPGVRTPCGRAGRAANTIVLQPGHYRLGVRPTGLDDNGSGDLNVTRARNLSIVGAGSARTVIDASGLGDRVLSIASGTRVTLNGLTIRGGHAANGSAGLTESAGAACAPGASAGNSGAGGGGILNAGTLTLRTAVVSGNTAGAGGAGAAGGGPPGPVGCVGGAGGAGGSGGGIYNAGTLTLTASFVSGNRAGSGGDGGRGAPAVGTSATGSGGAGGSGGAVFSTSKTVTLVNSTLVDNSVGDGGVGGQRAAGGNGGALAVFRGAGTIVNATIAHNLGGGIFVVSTAPREEVRLENTIVASNGHAQCIGIGPGAVIGAGHNLSFGDQPCPGLQANPRLATPRDNGGPTETLALRRGSPAINRVPKRHAHCPATDQRGVRRPQRGACDIGAFEYALPEITILQPSNRGSYEHRSRVPARFICSEGGITSAIARCRATVGAGHAINTRSVGTKLFRVVAVDKAGHRSVKTIRYDVWAYVNPLSQVSGLGPYRIDMGVDFSGSGPLLALGDARITFASNHDDGPPSCWGITCWPGGGAVVYRLLNGPFAGKYVYYAERVTATVRVGQTVRAGQQVAIEHLGSPNIEIGWGSGRGPETLSIAYGHQASGDPGGWSAIEGRNFNSLLVRLGAPSGFLQPGVPSQSMPRGWPALPGRLNSFFIPRSHVRMAEGAPPRSG
jgi:hypothetical protein